jgi:hypothetical protein
MLKRAAVFGMRGYREQLPEACTRPKVEGKGENAVSGLGPQRAG